MVPEVKTENKPQASPTSPLPTSAPTTTPAVVPEVKTENKPQASPTGTLQVNPAIAPSAPTVIKAAVDSSATTVNAVQPVNKAEVKAPN